VKVNCRTFRRCLSEGRSILVIFDEGDDDPFCFAVCASESATSETTRARRSVKQGEVFFMVWKKREDDERETRRYSIPTPVALSRPPRGADSINDSTIADRRSSPVLALKLAHERD
jgi:hypothetical protein